MALSDEAAPHDEAVGAWGTVAVALLLLATLVAPARGATPGDLTPDEPGVHRIAGPDRWATSAAVSRAAFSPGVNAAWIASGLDAADALGAAAVAGLQGGPVLLTYPDRIPAAIAAELRRLNPSSIRVAGGHAAVSPVVEQALAAIAPVERVAGSTRFDTAVEVARTRDRGAATVWIAEGTGFADALAGAPAAARDDAPLLLTRRNTLPHATATELRRLEPDRIVVLGGSNAISDGVVTKLRALSPHVERVAGVDRYATAAAVAARSFDDATDVVVASGVHFADALSIAAPAGRDSLPIHLTHPRRLPAATAAAVDAPGPRSTTIVGGSAAVGNDVGLELASRTSLPTWNPVVSTVTAAELGSSWRNGCPRGPGGLRLLAMPHVGFDGQVRNGRLIVATELVDDTASAFHDLWEARFPIRRMRTIDVYGGDDDRSMAADNTSAFNCRRITGGTSWSNHSYGRAIDINPRENPYVRGSLVLPPEGAAYLDRGDVRAGMLVAVRDEVQAFTQRGFTWGGDWTSLKDYQHVER